ncbi:MAG: hypothetical protein JXK05_06500, partial [Campylobacterales bacterium]|nr:hypothetical protein [Campylobacterales bacterium]
MAFTKNMSVIALSAATAALLTLSGCGGGGGGGSDTSSSSSSSVSSSSSSSSSSTGIKKEVTLTGDITSDMTLTADTNWILDGLVVVKAGATLTIEPGTTIAGMDGTGDSTSYMIIDK